MVSHWWRVPDIILNKSISFVFHLKILWGTSGTKISMFSEHKGFVQGVAADPLQKYIATLSSDR